MTTERPLTSECRHVIAEFEHTRPRHGGRVEFAAPILNVSEALLEQLLYRAKRHGVDVKFMTSEPRG